MKKAIIVGGGPAGLAAAYTLAHNSREKLEITLIDQGKRVEQRTREDASYGIGGVGAFSDGKFIFDTIIGKRQIGTNLNELGLDDKAYLIKAKEIFRQFYEPLHGKMQEVSEDRMKKAYEIQRIAGRNDMDYIVAHDYHIGTDRLPELIGTMQTDLEKSGVNIITGERVHDFEKGKVFTRYNGDEKTKEYSADYIMIAPGRNGSNWLDEKLKEKSISHRSRPIDIGLRIETDAAVLKHLTDIERDVKLEFRHPNGDLIRTFCVCPYGQVAPDKPKPEFGGLDFCLVNGASSSTKLSNNTNFALLVRMPLSEEGDNAKWGIKQAETAEVAGVKRIIVQRYGELTQERRSQPSKVSEWRIQPTLPEKHYMIGDVRIGMNARIMDGLRYGIKRLSVPGLMEGLDQASTLLYGPEMKMHGICISTTNYLESTSIPDIYFAGDGTGISRGIGGAMASGIRAAEGIISKL